MKPIALGLAVLCVAFGASAQRISRVDGNRVLAACTAKQLVTCDAFVSGVADSIGLQPEGKRPACIADGVTGTQLREVLVKYLRAHPETREQNAALLTARALAAAFPCRK